MKKFAIGAAFVVGVVLGGTSMNLLAMKASKVYLHAIRSDYLAQEELLAVQAQKRHDFNQALVHYNNMVYATSAPGDAFFKTAQSKWSFWFPFAALVIDQMGRDSKSSGLAQNKIEGINRGKLGMILEALGKKNEAEKQYQMAADLMGIKDIQRLKETIRQMSKGS
jgi:hypothetical protein